MQSVDDFFDEIDRRTQAVQRLVDGNAWRIQPGMEFYINSEFKCPLCLKGHKTNLVYMVDTEHRRLVGCWSYPEMNPVGNQGKEVIHPHSDNNGKLCMGSAHSAAQLLFNGIAPGKHHRHTDAWLLYIGHECSKINKVACVVCGTDEYQVYSLPYNRKWACSYQCERLAHKTICYKCGNYLGQGSIKNYCEDCFYEDSMNCRHCNERVLMVTLHHMGDQFYVCYDCYENRTGVCSGCNAPTAYNQMRARRCHMCQPVECARCWRSVPRRELVNGRCEKCRPKYSCRCGSLVPAAGNICATCAAGPQASSAESEPAPMPDSFDEPF